jgi:hypothetical protein
LLTRAPRLRQVNKCARLARRLEYVQDTLKTLQARLEP